MRKLLVIIASIVLVLILVSSGGISKTALFSYFDPDVSSRNEFDDWLSGGQISIENGEVSELHILGR